MIRHILFGNRIFFGDVPVIQPLHRAYLSLQLKHSTLDTVPKTAKNRCQNRFHFHKITLLTYIYTPVNHVPCTYITNNNWKMLQKVRNFLQENDNKLFKNTYVKPWGKSSIPPISHIFQNFICIHPIFTGHNMVCCI